MLTPESSSVLPKLTLGIRGSAVEKCRSDSHLQERHSMRSLCTRAAARAASVERRGSYLTTLTDARRWSSSQ